MKINKSGNTFKFNVRCTNPTKCVCSILHEYSENAVWAMKVAAKISKKYELGEVSKERYDIISELLRVILKPLIEADEKKYKCDTCPFREVNHGEHIDMVISLFP